MNVSRLTIQKMIAVTAMAMAIPMSAYAGHHEEGGKKQHSEMRVLCKFMQSVANTSYQRGDNSND